MTVVSLRKGEDPHVTAAIAARNRVRELIEKRLAEGKGGGKSRRATARLKAALDDINTKQGDPNALTECLDLVRKRLRGLNRSAIDVRLDAQQQIDLMIILVFGSGRLSRDLLEQAFAALVLKGPRRTRELIGEAFPGLADVFAK
jgi:hypothetical protein